MRWENLEESGMGFHMRPCLYYTTECAEMVEKPGAEKENMQKNRGIGRGFFCLG